MARHNLGWFAGLLLVPLLGACPASMIPGTNIADNKENRGLLKELEQYRLAIEHRDASALLDLVSPNYYDTRGHPDDPTFHWNYDRVRTELPERLSQVREVRLEIDPRRIEVKKNHAQVSYLFTQNFMAELPSGEIAKHESDLNRMEFDRVGDKWLITKGL